MSAAGCCWTNWAYWTVWTWVDESQMPKDIVILNHCTLSKSPADYSWSLGLLASERAFQSAIP